MSEGQFQSLFQPIQIGPLRLRNRVVMPPMSTNFGDPENPGFVSERHKSYYGERAKGGAALIILEATASGRSTAFRKLGLGLYDDQFIPGLHDLVQRIKACGAACAIQIAAAGAGRIGAMKLDGDGNPDRSSLTPDGYFAASPLPHPMTGIVAQELSHRQLEEIAGDLAKAAKRAVQAGFDAIEIHGAHGYLLAEFLSPYTNKRADQYGGDIEGRSRFPLHVVTRVKEEVGDSVVLSYRMSAVEFIPGGLDISDAILFAKKLEKAGVHVLHISAGTNETPSSMNRVIPPMSFPRGRLVPYAEQIRKEVRIPVIVVQRINTPELADQVIREGKADLVATGRALIADPYWPLKAKGGRLDEIRRCIACNQGCMEQIVLGNTLTCLHNPEVGHENAYPSGKKAEKSKRVLVVGGGLSGMEAAYVVATKGYDVKLVEKEDELGGTARVASVLNEKSEFAGVIEFLENQLKKLKVEIRLKEDFTVQGIKDEPFDEIIIATGSTPLIPKLNLHHNKYNVRLAKDVLDNAEGTGQDVFVLGGGSVGIEVAEYLDRYLGKNVTVIEMLDKICGDLGPLNRVNVLERIDRSSIKMMLKTKVLELNDEGIIISKDGKEEVLKPPDTVVVAMGAKPNPRPVEGIEGRIHYIGDCKKAGNAMDAIHDAFHVAVTL